jgi:hypothetical protein
VAAQVHLSWVSEEDTALRIAHEHWRSNVFGPPVCWDLELAEHFDVVSADVTPEKVASVVNFYNVDPRLGTLGDFVEFLRPPRTAACG